MKSEKNIWNLIESCLHYLLYNVLRLKLSPLQWNGLIQFVKFGLVGLSNTIISYIIYLIVFSLMQTLNLFSDFDYLIAQVISYMLSILWSFYLNNKYVFKQQENHKRNIIRALLKTYISYSFTGIFLNSLLSIFWVEILHLSKVIAPCINLLISIPVNFIINKFWAFRDSKKE